MPREISHHLTLALVVLISLGCDSAPDATVPALSGNAGRSGSQSASDKPISPGDKPISPGDKPISQGYVGSAACADCHLAETNSYHGHPMSKSLFPAVEAPAIEDYEHARFESVDSVTYYVEKTSAGIVHHEKRVDSEGNVIYDQGKTIAFTVGSGERGRSYLIQDDGRLFVSPISWYSGPARWDLSPGYEPGVHRRFERRVSDGCIVCHAGRVAIDGEQDSRFRPDPFPEPAIGCERCHGPGKEHVERRSAGLAESDVDPIFNPAKVTDARRDAVCNQCHLQGQLRVVRSGRTEYDFRPGMNLSDNWLIFLKTEGVEGGVAAAVSQVEQMYASRCYKQSSGALSCIGCHDGHRPPSRELSGEHYRKQCLECHGSGSRECVEQPELRSAADNDSCIVCHMPKAPAGDVHAAQTDHRILRRAPTQDPDAPRRKFRLKESRAVLFVEPGVRVPQLELDRARGIFYADQAGSGGTEEQARGAIDLLIEVMKQLPVDIESRYHVGLAFERVKQPQLAAQAWEYVLTLRPQYEDALEALGASCQLNRDFAGARIYYERLLEINPGRSRIHGRLAYVLGQLRAPQRSIEYAKRSLELNPSLVQNHVWLAELYRSLGEEENADIHAAIVQQFRSGATQNEKPAD